MSTPFFFQNKAYEKWISAQKLTYVIWRLYEMEIAYALLLFFPPNDHSRGKSTHTHSLTSLTGHTKQTTNTPQSIKRKQSYSLGFVKFVSIAHVCMCVCGRIFRSTTNVEIQIQILFGIHKLFWYRWCSFFIVWFCLLRPNLATTLAICAFLSHLGSVVAENFRCFMHCTRLHNWKVSCLTFFLLFFYYRLCIFFPLWCSVHSFV